MAGRGPVRTGSFGWTAHANPVGSWWRPDKAWVRLAWGPTQVLQFFARLLWIRSLGGWFSSIFSVILLRLLTIWIVMVMVKMPISNLLVQTNFGSLSYLSRHKFPKILDLSHLLAKLLIISDNIQNGWRFLSKFLNS